MLSKADAALCPHLCDCLAQGALHALSATRVRQQHSAAVADYLRLLV